MKWLARHTVRRLIGFAITAALITTITTGSTDPVLNSIGQVPKAVAKVPEMLGFKELAERIAAVANGSNGKRQVRGAVVARTIDGDTLEVRFPNGTEADVRLIGYDTPEATTKTECGGPEASAFTKRITEGRKVKLITDPTQDKVDRYGRLLRYARVNGKDVGRRVISAGWGAPYVYNSSSPPRNTDTYRKAAANAKAAGKGVWGLCAGNFHSLDDQPWSGD